MNPQKKSLTVSLLELECAGLFLESPAPLKYISDVTSSWHHASLALISIFMPERVLQLWKVSLTHNLMGSAHPLTNVTSNQVGLPAELKHINKRR
ncbi:hypothetical protein, partial [Staphylococcus pseudintermedius]|uniref:hypothetical protein n=1 Tax=Staphylococcus pseudintermedius TaxID=283734 RepID=UPI001C6DD94C